MKQLLNIILSFFEEEAKIIENSDLKEEDELVTTIYLINVTSPCKIKVLSSILS
ncbi:MAG: hypothetical protein IPP15_15115 [Saprospiraceae bacterium]|uniref:Uncharacterized protein n=1 Tax=Candidatus Opimibacter skivensis TaxID=2982028 RepID=A0A9D7SWX7_9BACT|nr:hypothetical protein [Candidatus Opimibacter skivensis]